MGGSLFRAIGINKLLENDKMAKPATIFSFHLRNLCLGFLILALTSQFHDSFAQDICDNPVVLTGPIDTVAIVPDVVVRADTIIGESNPALCVTVTTAGHYRIYATVSQSLGQFNESYFLTVCDEGGSNCTPACDPNAGPYKIILDDTLSSAGTVKSDAGIYFFEQGKNVITLNHLSLVDHLFPELVRGDSISSAESVHLKELIIEEVNNTYDLGLTQSASQGSVRPDSTYSYHLNMVNNGSATVHNIDLWNALPGFVTPEQFLLTAPDLVRADTLFWHFDSLQTAQSIDIEFTVRFSQTPPATPFDLINRSRLTANCDTVLTNNFAATTILGLPPIQYDLALTKSANKDSAQVGQSFSYNLKVVNNGPDPASDIVLWDVLPNFILISDFTLQPDSTNQDTLFWRFDSLAVGDSVVIIFDARVEETIPALPFQLHNSAEVTAPQEIIASNNTAAAVVMAVPMRYDLALTKSADLDSVQIGPRFTYSLKIVNLGPDPATDIRLSDIFPDFVALVDFSLPPVSTSQDTLFWQFDTLAVGDSIQIILGARIEPTLPSLPVQIINTASVTAPGDANFANNTATAVIRAVPMRYDLELTKSADLDSVQIGGGFSYALKIVNHGPDPATDIRLSDILPSYVSIVDFSLQPSSTSQDTLFWQFNTLAVGDSIQITLGVRIEPTLPSLPLQIINTAFVTAPDDANLANSTAKALVTIIPISYDLEITKSASADTLRPKRSFDYSLKVINHGPDTAKDILIWDVKPEFITFSDISPQPSTVNQDTLIWRVDSLRIGETFEITIGTRVDELNLTNPLEIINTGSVAAVDDFNSANNSADASVVVLPPNDCVYLDRNVFMPDSGSPLQVIFQLSTSRTARLDLYDTTGYHLSTLVEQNFNAGSNTYLWDGTINNGRKAGSGVYILTFRSGTLVCWVKVIVVQ
ncbi:MAG: DUF11 domain-containing protein [Caldithrix sp.]|nr:MAG: DUF11 domain-containing protein [Caldithrix sp.]